MNERARDLGVGIFVLGALVLLVGGLFALGFRESFEPKVKAETAVTGDVQGLTVGSPVLIRGIRVGEVTSIGFTWNDYPGTRTDLALVRFEVKRAILPEAPGFDVPERWQAEIGRGLRVRIRSQALTGTSILSVERLDPKENPPPTIDFAPRDLYVPSAPSQLTRMLDAIERTLDALQEVRIQPLLEMVDRALASVEVLARQLEALRLDQIERKANLAADEVVLAARNLHEGLASAREQIQQLRLGESGERLARLLDELQGTTVQLRTTLGRIEGVDVEGINEAITGLGRATEGLEQTLQEIRDYPAGTLLGAPPRHPGSLEERKR